MTDQSSSRSAPGLADMHADGRQVAPSALRNELPIQQALAPIVDGLSGLALEIGSGTGQHAAGWAHAFPNLDWQPSDPFDLQLESIRAWVAHATTPNLRAPIWLDAAEEWPKLGSLALIISLNVIHISPWAVAQGICRGAGQSLAVGGKLVFYGPFKEGGVHTGEGNATFDASLRERDPAWGIRDLGDVADLAAEAGLSAPTIITMPANNRLVVFERH